jgi:D-sedoheptulose 7-phosphate isomerase
MRAASVTAPIAFVEAQLLQRSASSEPFFARYGDSLARVCQMMADRFAMRGRLLAFGERQYATDAQHIEVEFVHPVLVGKAALPALDISDSYRESLRAILQPADIVIAFGPPEGSVDLDSAVAWAAAQGALTLALPGNAGQFSIDPWSVDPFIHQELVEILYHTLWETVHVFLEHREGRYDAGPASFLYPFLSSDQPRTQGLVGEVACSIRAKAAEDDRLRLRLVAEEGEGIVRAACAIHHRVQQGGGLILFGNGGSATDANDWALDCIASPKSYSPIPAISLSRAPAALSALANDIGTKEIFLRQLIAYARPNDVAVGISTSGGSQNVIAALDEARRRGLLTVALLGHDGGEIVRRKAADHVIVVRSDYVPRVQEIQASTYHVMLDLLHALRGGDVLALEAPSPS